MFLNEVKVNVKPIFINYIPDQVPAGPSVLPEEIAKKSIDEKMNIFKRLKGVNLLESYVVESEEDILKVGGELAKDVDFVLTQQVGPVYHSGWRTSFPTEIRIGEYNVPLLKLATNVWDFEYLEVVMALRASGEKAYYGPSIEKMNKYLRIQQIKKALSKSKLLIFESTPDRIQLMTKFYDSVLIKERTGIEIAYYPPEKLREAIKEISDEEGEKVANDWFNGATSVRTLYRENELDKKYRINLGKLDIAIREAIKTQKATAVAGCGGPGSALSPDRAPPCLTFTWLKDEGIPAVCQADISNALPMIMLMFVAEAPADMGNIYINTGAEHMMDLEVPNPDANTVILGHSVTPRKMKGFDSTPNEYEIIGTHCDTCFGANHVTHTEIEPGQMATLARMGPKCEKLLLIKGKVTKSGFTPQQGNRQVTYFDLGKSISDFLEENISYLGEHLTWVFGDHVEEMSSLCKELGIEPVIF